MVTFLFARYGPQKSEISNHTLFPYYFSKVYFVGGGVYCRPPTGGDCTIGVTHFQKIDFLKSEISLSQSNHDKRNIKLMLVRPQKRFRTTCSISEIITKNWIFALPLHVSAGIATERCKESKYPTFCDYLKDAASGPKTFLGPN